MLMYADYWTDPRGRAIKVARAVASNPKLGAYLIYGHRSAHVSSKESLVGKIMLSIFYTTNTRTIQQYCTGYIGAPITD